MYLLYLSYHVLALLFLFCFFFLIIAYWHPWGKGPQEIPVDKRKKRMENETNNERIK